MPGGMLSISADGSTPGTGILWASLPDSGDGNHAIVPGVLRAFDAADVGHELWSSREDADADDCGNFAKFSSPTVANGKVYLAIFSGQVCVYGLKESSANAPATPAGTAGGAAASSSSRP